MEPWRTHSGDWPGAGRRPASGGTAQDGSVLLGCVYMGGGLLPPPAL